MATNSPPLGEDTTESIPLVEWETGHFGCKEYTDFILRHILRTATAEESSNRVSGELVAFAVVSVQAAPGFSQVIPMILRYLSMYLGILYDNIL